WRRSWWQFLDGVGTNGIAFNSKIVPLQNYNYNEQDDIDKEEATARCVLKAIEIPEVNIIVLENQTATGSSETFSGTRDAVRLAIRSGLIVIGAAGNSGVELKEELKDDTGSIIVGALSKSGAPPTTVTTVSASRSALTAKSSTPSMGPTASSAILAAPRARHRRSRPPSP
ncbi:MAG: S8 family serine peptidase, partial [Calothrix sp. SM1_5_4]|nr:S8 family serine peptidase [Calothrix sp. SM1_5_4]